MALYYISSVSGIAAANPSEFELDDSEETFHSSPRVFTTFRPQPESLRRFAAEDPQWREMFPRPAEHLERVFYDAASLGIFNGSAEYHRPEHVEQLMLSTINQYTREEWDGIGTPIIRIILSRESAAVHLSTSDAPPHGSGITRLRSLVAERPMSEYKTTLTAVSRRAQATARQFGDDDALLLGPDQVVREAAWANIFWFDRNGSLHTPERDLLPGVTRGILLQHWPCSLTSITADTLAETAREIFLTKATAGVVPVGWVDGKAIGNGAPGEQTAEISQWLLNSYAG